MTIITDLGTITANVDTRNLKILMFLDSLKDKIEIYGLDEIISLIDGSVSTKELREKITKLENTIIEKDNEISELEDGNDFEIGCDSTINCGIGEINYESPNNLLLQDLLGNLDTAIKKHTPKKVSEILSSMS